MNNLIKELKNNLDFYFSEVLGKPIVKPHWIYVSLSHKCTFRCQMCGVVNILNGYELKQGEVEKVIDDIAGWNNNSVMVITGGEPFLNKNIFDIIKYGVVRNLKIEIVSNGSLIDNELAEKIVASGLQNIAISLDGANEETHDYIREKGAFKKALNAIKLLTEIKKTKGMGPQISVWTTIMKENVRELYDIIPLVKDFGVECLVYHPVVVAQDDMQNTSPNAPFWIKGDDLVILKDEIGKIVKYEKEHGLVVFLHNPYMWVEHFKGSLTKKDWKCNPFVFINIGPDAEVRSCGTAFGNVKDIGLNACLSTREADKARKIMQQCQKPCLQTCWAHPESDSLKSIIEDFIHKTNEVQDKTLILEEGLRLLARYKKMVEENV